MPLDKTEKLKKLLEVANEDYMSISQARELLLSLGEAVKKLKRQLQDDFNADKRDLISQLNLALDKVENEIDQLDNKHIQEIKRLATDFDNKLSSLKAEIPQATDLTEVWNAIKGIIIPKTDEILAEVEQKLPQYGSKYRDGLELLQGDDRLDKSAIKGLTEELKEIKKIKTTASGGVRRVFQPYLDDFSAQTDGVTKTFYLSREPLKTDTIQVWGTDFPIILRPTTDFTVSGKTLTLTSAVPAPNTGSTLLVQYFA